MIRLSLLALVALGVVVLVAYCSSPAIPRGSVVINVAQGDSR